MFNFSTPLEQAPDPRTGLVKFGFVHNGGVFTDPYRSSCGRFTAEPLQTCGVSNEEAGQLTELNTLLEDATRMAVTAACETIQYKLRVPSGDVADRFFSGTQQTRVVCKVIAAYLQLELQQAGVSVND